MSELPQAWIGTELGNLFSFVIGGDWGKSPEFNEDGFENVFCIRGSEFRNWVRDKGSTASLRKVRVDSIEKRKLQIGDILVEISGGGPDQPVGRTVLIDEEVLKNNPDVPRVCTNFLRLARPHDEIIAAYLNHYLTHFYKTGEIVNYQSGSNNLRNLQFGKYSKIEIPLAPYAEQKRIADKLDSVLARVDATRHRLDRIPNILKQFRQSVLAAATSGKLTEGWRNDNPSGIEALDEIKTNLKIRLPTEKKEPAEPDLSNWEEEIPKGWALCSVHQFSECLDRLRIPIKRDERKNSKGLYPYYGANGEVSKIDDYIFDDELVLVTEDETFYGREKPIAYRSSGKCWVNNHAHVLRPADKVSADYLCYSLMYYDVIPWLTGTTGRAKLTQMAMNSLPILAPPKIEMIEIVRRVEALFALADKLEARYNTAHAQVEKLMPSLLAKAFRGELVEQDPNDEPAEKLLERIKAERESAVKVPKGKMKKTG